MLHCNKPLQLKVRFWSSARPHALHVQKFGKKGEFLIIFNTDAFALETVYASRLYLLFTRFSK